MFHHTLIEQLKTKYRNTKEERYKQIFARMFTGGILKRYKLQQITQKELGFSSKRFRKGLSEGNQFVRKTYMCASQ